MNTDKPERNLTTHVQAVNTVWRELDLMIKCYPFSRHAPGGAMTIGDKLLPVFFACASALLAQPQAGPDPGTVIRVVDLIYNPGEPRVSFGVVNISAKPVLAYSLKYT